MFGTPTYQWLPAKWAVEKSFALFYAPLPEGVTKVTDVRLENGQLLIEDGLGPSHHFVVHGFALNWSPVRITHGGF